MFVNVIALLAYFTTLLGCGPAAITPAGQSAAPLAGQQQPPPALPETGTPLPETATPETATLETTPLDDLLDRLERSAEDLTGFRGKVRYDVYDALTDETQTRRGAIIYRVEDGDKRFAIRFDELIIDDGMERRRKKRTTQYVFDGHWLVEIDEADKQFIKHELVPPGRKLDPLRLEGPLPLPVGQPKEEVLARFDASLIGPPPGNPEDLRGSDRALARLKERGELDGLMLVPKPGTQLAREHTHLDLWYDRVTLIPVGINVVMKNGNRKVVVLSEPTRNPVFDQATLDLLTIDEPQDPGWQKSVNAWSGDG